MCYFLLHQRAQDFNPRSPRGGATITTQMIAHDTEISIHAPHEGERPVWQGAKRPYQHFNPRSPRGGATRDKCRGSIFGRISIHAPHEGERLRLPRVLPAFTAISIHAPHEGERPRDASNSCTTSLDFNPRSPRGGATAEKCIYMQHFREFAEYYPLRRGDARCIAPQDCIIQAFFGAKEQRFYVRLYFALKNKGIRG